MIILLHSSKTMRFVPSKGRVLRSPMLINKAQKLQDYLQTLSVGQVAKIMKVSSVLAQKTHDLIKQWTSNPQQQSCAVDSFLGDIYSGLQAQKMSSSEREYADKVLFILSGLYGVLRPLDGVCSYRLEMGYKLPNPEFSNLPKFWGRAVVECLPPKGLIVNLAADEYSQVVLPFVDAERVVSPKFLTMDPHTGVPKFVVVHAKVARGAFARWLIVNRVEDVQLLRNFSDLNYRFDAHLSTPSVPVFVCKTFGGLGLSIKKSV